MKIRKFYVNMCSMANFDTRGKVWTKEDQIKENLNANFDTRGKVWTKEDQLKENLNEIRKCYVNMYNMANFDTRGKLWTSAVVASCEPTFY